MQNQIQCILRHCAHNKFCGCKKNQKHLKRDKICENYQDPRFMQLKQELQQFLRVHENPRYFNCQICAGHSEIYELIENFLQNENEDSQLQLLQNLINSMKPDNFLLFHILTRKLMLKLQNIMINFEHLIMILKLIRKYTFEVFQYNKYDQNLILDQIINQRFLKIELNENENDQLVYELLLGIITNISLTIKQPYQLDNELQIVYKKVKQSFKLILNKRIITVNILFLKYMFQIDYFEEMMDQDFYEILEYICINFRQLEIQIQQDIIKMVSMKLFNDFEKFLQKQIEIHQDFNLLLEKFIENCTLNKKSYSQEIHYFLEKLIQKR